MNESKNWWSGVSAGTVSSVAAAVIIALGAAVWSPARAWLSGSVSLMVWLLALALCACFVAGFWLGRMLGNRAPPPMVSDRHALKTTPYQPAAEEDSVIRLLRLADSRPLSARELADYLPVGTGVRDVELWAGNLKRAGFVRDVLNYYEGQSFTLDDRGVAYAQQKGYPVGAHAFRSGFRLAKHREE